MNENNSCNGIHDSEYVMTFTIAITSISNTLKKLLLQYDLHSSQNQNIYIGEEEIIHNVFSTYVEPLLNYINHTELVQEWKINPDALAYEKQIDANVNRPSDKNKLIIMTEKRNGQ